MRTLWNVLEPQYKNGLQYESNFKFGKQNLKLIFKILKLLIKKLICHRFIYRGLASFIKSEDIQANKSRL
jgi:hypothetical protein